MAVNPTRRGLGSADWTTEQDVEGFLETWGNALLATARRYSPSATDADDAYQRAIEILLTKRPEHESEGHRVAWMQTVVRNEALQLHRSKRNLVDEEFERIGETLMADTPQPDETFELNEELAWGREALARIRPDQTRCMLLKADGNSNPEICEITGFSYAKVNRLLSEGRKALGLRVASISGGRECQRVEPLLMLMADDAADTATVADVKLHLEHCSACQATLRDLRDAPSSLAALFPVGTAIVSDRSLWSAATDQINSWIASLQERLFGPAVQGAESITAKKIAATASVVAALAGGAVVVERNVDREPADELPAETTTAETMIDELEVAKTTEPERRRSAAEARAAADRDLLSVPAAPDQGTRTEGQVLPDEQVAADPNALAPADAPDDTGLEVEGLGP